MILGAEIGMFIMGVIALVKGKLTLTKNKVVEGTAARLLAIVLMMPIPVAFTVGLIWGIAINVGNAGGGIQQPGFGSLVAMELGIVVVCAAIVYGVGLSLAPAPPPE